MQTSVRLNNIEVMASVAVASLNDGAVVAWPDTRNGNSISNTQDIFTGTAPSARPRSTA